MGSIRSPRRQGARRARIRRDTSWSSKTTSLPYSWVVPTDSRIACRSRSARDCPSPSIAEVAMSDRCRIILAAVVLAALDASLAQAQGGRVLPDSTVRAIDALFAPYAHSGSPGCAVGVYQNGAVTFARGYGFADLNHDVPITASTRFTVGSVSKQFTAASIALLAQAGRISLDDYVRKYIPELPAYQAPVTIRHLVHHTSGVRDFWELVTLAG